MQLESGVAGAIVGKNVVCVSAHLQLNMLMYMHFKSCPFSTAAAAQMAPSVMMAGTVQQKTGARMASVWARSVYVVAKVITRLASLGSVMRKATNV